MARFNINQLPRKFQLQVQEQLSEASKFAVPIKEAEQPKPKKRIRQDPKPLLNKLEEEFAAKLEVEFGMRPIRSQAMKLKLGNGIFYKPDFIVFAPDCDGKIFRVYEVKGPFAHRGGFENLKVAAHQWPELKFILAWKENGQWVEQIVLP